MNTILFPTIVIIPRVDEEVTIKEEEFEESSESEAEIVGETPQSTRKVRDANLCPGTLNKPNNCQPMPWYVEQAQQLPTYYLVRLTSPTIANLCPGTFNKPNNCQPMPWYV